MNDKIDELINSDKYKPLKLYRDYDCIYTNKYEDKYDGYMNVLIPEEKPGFVCAYTDTEFEFGLIDYCISAQDMYNWDEELESRETIFYNEFESKEDMILFLEFEFDLLNLLNSELPQIDKKIDVVKVDYEADVDTDEKYIVYYGEDQFMRYYLDDYQEHHDYYFSLIACADIEWECWEDFPTLDDDLDDWWEDPDEPTEACVKEYKRFSVLDAKNIVYTLLKIIKHLK